MNDENMEALVRDTFRTREHLVPDPDNRLVGSVRARVHRRHRRMQAALAGVVVVALLGGTGMTLRALAGTGNAPVTGASPTGASAWRLVSSLGVEVSVPGNWVIGTIGSQCPGSTGPDNVQRYRGAAPSCPASMSQPPHLQTPAQEAIIDVPEPGSPETVLPGRSVTVDGVAATRADGLLPDGRFAAVLTVPSRQVAVTARAREEAVAKRIVDSVRLVDTDHLGCATRRPDRLPAGPGQTESFVPNSPGTIAICYYSNDHHPEGPHGRLQASVALTGAEAAALADAVNAAPPGRNPDTPTDNCPPDLAPRVDLVLRVHGRDAVTPVAVTSRSCTRGLDNGTGQISLSPQLHALLVKPLIINHLPPQNPGTR